MKNKALSFYDNAMININVIHGAHLAEKEITVMGWLRISLPSPSLPLEENMVFYGRPRE